MTDSASPTAGDSGAYTGAVRPGGPSAVRTLPDLEIRKASVSEEDNNAYLLTDRATGAKLLIDAADSPQRLTELLAESSDGALAAVVTTHQHWDHHRALAEVVASTSAPTLAGAEDASALPVKPDRELRHGDRVEFGDLALEVIHLRGHTPGSVALLFTSSDGSRHLFTGDSLFPGGPGKTWSAADFVSLMDDLEARVFGALPDETWVYPGHGNDTTLGVERPHLAEWRSRGW